MDYSFPPHKAVSRLYIFPPADQSTPKQIQLIFQSITAPLPIRRSDTNILQISNTAYRQIPILQYDNDNNGNDDYSNEDDDDDDDDNDDDGDDDDDDDDDDDADDDADDEDNDDCGLNVDLPKAGHEPRTSRSESRASATRPRRQTIRLVMACRGTNVKRFEHLLYTP
ncbi:hypothetical protein ElyMa_005364300 [Elysia marginata]|uniref:Uncharacterized protein n=1 Tax=Elysia marginata TaxID=1093978 RepID=A0AAV4EDG7_9GAST|nr:hypothetical protein ElyMa_005364300 [Elysia marginata]